MCYAQIQLLRLAHRAGFHAQPRTAVEALQRYGYQILSVLCIGYRAAAPSGRKPSVYKLRRSFIHLPSYFIIIHIRRLLNFRFILPLLILYI